MARHVNRRLFLRGLGGACVAAPFLSSVANRSVKAQATAAPRRLIVMFTHYGCVTTHYFPAKSHGPLTAADLQPTTLNHLVPYVGKVLMPRGIRAMNEWNQYMSRGQGNDPHTQVVGSYFTCQPVSPNSDNPFSFDASTKFNAMPVGPSLDHVIARQLSPTGTPLLLHVGNQVDTPQSGISYSDSMTPYLGIGTPTQAFATLTGLFQGGAMSPDTYQAFRGKSVIDVVRDDLDTLERFDMSQSDKNRLEAWKALLDDTGGMIAAAQCNADTANVLGLTQANLAAAVDQPTNGSDVLTNKVNDTDLDGADMYSNIAALAAVCNATPVIVLKYPSSYVFKGLGITTESASLSHRLDNAGLSGACMPDAIQNLLKIDDYYATKFAYLVELLNGIDEGDGKVLDNTAAVWFQEMSDGLAMNLNNMPIVQVGSCGGYFKTGWAVNVDDGSATLTPGNSEAFCVDGAPDMVNGLDQVSGTDPSLANAPINKYYYALMNALGVTAGDDGFPAKGGSARVTKFGMYDKTEDFIGGGTNPPLIHSPGEFSALRAGS
jgi:hypothetical protein